MHKNSLTTVQIVIRISIIIAITEFIIMLIINLLPANTNSVSEAAIDVLLLGFISIPMIYNWVIKPFVIARDEAFAHLNQLADTDPLTRLPNRRYLLSHLQRTIASCNRHKIYSALLLIDLDGFKVINDVHGHDAGDAVLVEVASRFRSAIRSEDIAARLGGDEFVILIDHLDASEQPARTKALQLAEKLIHRANDPITFNGQNLQVGASAGISLIRFDHIEANTVIRQADIAMYRSKKNGKGRATFSD